MIIESNHSFGLTELIFACLFAVLLVAGVALFRNLRRLVGAIPGIRAENNGERSYAALLLILVWLHAVLLSGAFAFVLH